MSDRTGRNDSGAAATAADGVTLPRAVRVLLIEDNPGDVEIVRSLLAASHSLHFELTTASTLSEGLVRLRAERPDVALLDLSLPDSQGPATVASVRLENGSLPIVVITGNDDEERALNILRGGADGYMLKDELCTSLLVRTLWHAIDRQRIATDLRESLAREHQVATHDALTGLPNRTSFLERLSRRLRVARAKADDTVAVLVVDLDRFRRLNDRFGYSEGDELMRLAASRVRSCLRSDEMLCRVGGDEFAVVMTGFRNDIDAARVSARVHRAFEDGFSLDGGMCVLTTSIGIAVYPQDGTDAEALISSAETALYHAKRFGGDRYEFYRPELNASAAERLDLEVELRSAVRNDELIVHYQPKVDGREMAWRGSEALVRWQHPERGLVPPGKFIPVAEEVGLIGEIGDWVLGAACRQGRIWQERGVPMLPVSVNVSGHQFENEGFVERVLEWLEASQLAPENLELEITESILMSDLGKVREAIHALRRVGVRFSIDDFGTGYSSLSVLRSLPVNVLKVDRSFVKGVADDERDAGLAQAIVALAHGLDLETIAEGVETSEQAERLSAMGCRYLQGFLFSPPLPSAELEALLASAPAELLKATD
jgi:diguanylate cyclase (GGDEF)-like protein